ncbi:3-oxoacyl-ACP reductase [Bacillus sp. FJAT-27916]|uniref:SDR family oxidoreductase n=1 Tax=Bacillus sp. FJAT-27916 TaxID=1679169 RepID=UPI0006713D5F|nr:SDR family oxidoreductase [Bacillus sp. FJAT-27916]KMY46413.1 3-oxoacyl-ACP reductase [Bacillus sp. FJAT-27916]
MELGLKGKNALVVASSQGLGKAIAIKLAEEGANVMVTSRSADKLKTVVEELKKVNPAGNYYWHEADITQADDIDRLVKATADKLGTIDILLNNAGGPPAGGFMDLSDEDWQKGFELNLLSYIRMIRAVLPNMKNGGRILNMASISVKEPIQGLLLSNTFRLGIVGLTKTLAAEFAERDILINTIAPGVIATDRIDYLDQVTAEKQGLTVEEVKERAEKQIPLGRYGKPEEFANYAVFLLSSVNSYVTGQVYLIDGGKAKGI